MRIFAVLLSVWLFMTSTVYAFDEIEDLDRAGTLGNKAPIPLPQNQYEDVTIMGDAVATKEQMIAYILANQDNLLLNCSLSDLVDYYYEEAAREGVRADVALCQAILETGFFDYGGEQGEVDPVQNNFCGLGATGDGSAGAFFATPRDGVRAHIQHLVAYADVRLPREKLIDPRYKILIERYPQYHGRVKYWVGLNGRWAVPGDTYGQDILAHWYAARQQ